MSGGSVGSREGSQVSGSGVPPSPLQALPPLAAGTTSSSTGQLAASAVAAAAAAITFTDADGIAWIEISDADMAAIYVS